MFPVGIVGTVKSFFFLETMMHVTTLLINFLFSAAAFEADEELSKMMRAATENLCAFDIANSSILDIKADIKNLNKDVIEGIRKIENLSQEMNKKVENLSQEMNKKVENLSEEFRDLSEEFRDLSEESGDLSEEFKNLSEEFKNLGQDFKKENEGVKKSIQDLIVRVDPLIARHNFVDK